MFLGFVAVLQGSCVVLQVDQSGVDPNLSSSAGSV